MNTTMADGAEQRLDAQIAEALFGQPGMSKMDVANRVRELRGDGPALLVPREAGQDERARFEAWYVGNAFDYEKNPIGSRECSLMWKAWQAGLATRQTAGREPVGYLYDWTHSSALGRGEETFTAFTPDIEAARGSKGAVNIRPVYAAQPSPGGQGWPFVESPADFAERMVQALRKFDMLGAVRHVLIEKPPGLAARQPVGQLHLPPDGYYKIVYDDAEVPDESFARTGALEAALRRFEQISARWNAHLFVRFANNTRDCTVPNATPAQAVDLEQSIPLELTPVAAALKRFDECAEDCGSEGCDIGRAWFDALTTMGLLKRTQRSPAVWTMTAEGERLLALIDGKAVGNG